MVREEIMDRALTYWGEDAQLLMVIEEMAELTQAILKHMRDKSGDRIETRDRIAEEEADVRIMLDQLSFIMSEYDETGKPSYRTRRRTWTENKTVRLCNLLDRVLIDKEGKHA